MAIKIPDELGQIWALTVNSDGTAQLTLSSGPPSIPPGLLTQGMSRARLIELANGRARRLGDKLNLDGEFLAVLQDFCSRYRWHWRRRSVAFNTVAGNPAYDLSDSSLGMIDVEQLISIKLVNSPDDIVPLNGVLDIHAQDELLESNKTGKPGAFFIQPGTNNVLYLSDIPDAAYKIRASFWAIPNMTLDAQDSRVPLVPGFMHRTLVKGLEAQILRYSLGETDKLYMGAKAEYEAEIAQYAQIREPIVGLNRQFISNDPAVRSH